MSDLIDRQAVIQMLNNADRYVADSLRLCDTDKTFPQNEVFIVDDMYENLEQLPSAQPTDRNGQERTGTDRDGQGRTGTDLISRQAAIDALIKCGDYYTGNDEAKRGVAQCIGVVYDLPSAQPEILARGQGELIAQPEHHAENLLAYAHDMGVTVEQAEKGLQRVTAQPERKTGRWIHVFVDGLSHRLDFECSVCGHRSEDKTRYCHNCGAKMEVEHETD